MHEKSTMFKHYTAKYTKISSGYMGQLIEWPEIVTEGKTFDDCRESLKDALHEMILAYKQTGQELPAEATLFEPLIVEIASVG